MCKHLEISHENTGVLLPFKRTRTAGNTGPSSCRTAAIRSREAALPCKRAMCSLVHYRPHHSLLSASPTSLICATGLATMGFGIVTPDIRDLIYFL